MLKDGVITKVHIINGIKGEFKNEKYKILF